MVGRHSRSAKFTFKAVGDTTSFQCVLVRVPRGKHAKTPAPHYATCGVSKTYTHLAKGTYVFFVRAVGPGGADKTPATHRFTIG
jgi:hypothetical protein